MADDNEWARFPITGTETKEGQEDDWGDFGGFETAQPVTDPAASNTSGVISWATAFSTTQPSPEPQQNSVSCDLSEGNQWAAFPPNKTPTTGDSTFETTVEQVQDTPNLSSTSFTDDSWNSKSEPMQHVQADDYISNKQAVERPLNVITVGSSQKHIEESQKTCTTKAINDLEEKLSLADQEKLELKEELENLLRKQQEVENVCKTTQENLEEQKQKYATLQEEHHQQLQDIRQAGHDALALIVEEYKELSKQATLEERGKNQAEFHNFLEIERRKFQEILTQQQEHLERTLAEEREKNDERVKEVIEEEQQNQKAAIECALNKERDEFKSTLETAIKETREQGEEAVKEAVSKEKEMHLALMEKMEKTMEEERVKFRTTTKEALDIERQQTKEAIQKAMAEEHNKSRETVKTSVEETKTFMNEYVKEKQEIDSQVRQKQYLVMDLFLESARTQLKNLMEGNHKS